MSLAAIEHVFASSRTAGIDRLVLLAIAYDSGGDRPALSAQLSLHHIATRTGLSVLTVGQSLVRLKVGREVEMAP